MSKFYDSIGFSKIVEGPLGVSKEEITELKVRGDVLQADLRFQSEAKVIDDLTVSNRISIPAKVMTTHGLPRYVTYEGSKWKVSFIERKTPRIILTLGGLYNGKV